MKIFLDTADLEYIKKYKHLISGVTTNPNLVAKLGDPNIVYEKHLAKILKIVRGPVSAETTSRDWEGMVKEGLQFMRILRDKKNVYIKVPCTHDGFRATAELKRHGIKTNVTLCFSVNQAFLAAEAGAGIISPFIGRVEHQNAGAGTRLIQGILDLYDAQDYKTELLAASFRTPGQVEEVIKITGKTGRGIDIITLPPGILDIMDHHCMTDAGIASFEERAKKYKGIGALGKKKK